MPRHTRPRPALPPELETASTAFGSRESLAILVLMAGGGPMTVPEICAELDMASNTVHRHVQALESMGAVQASQPPGSRRGKTVAFSVNPQVIREHLDQMRHILAPPRPGRPARSTRSPGFTSPTSTQPGA